ncbi:hypothetical protein [Dickeya ananatis]
MTLCIQPDDLVWRTFTPTSVPERDDASRLPHPSQALMADYLRAFFSLSRRNNRAGQRGAEPLAE